MRRMDRLERKILEGMGRKGLSKEVTFEHRPE
jgi:hypothetical protein